MPEDELIKKNSNPLNIEDQASHSKGNISHTRSSESQQVQILKNENRKLVYMLEKTEGLMKSKLKESKNKIEKIIGVINKVWKILQKQIVGSQQRRLYFDKNSAEEIKLKKLLKENEQLRNSNESRFVMLDNLGAILDLWWAKLAVKQESDLMMFKRNIQLEDELKLVKSNEFSLDKKIKDCEKEISRQRVSMDDMNMRIDELEAFKLTTLDSTVHQLAEQEELLISSQELNKPNPKLQKINKASESNDLPTFGCVSFQKDCESEFKCQNEVYVSPADIWKDVDLVPSYMRALTNEIVYLYDEIDNSCEIFNSTKCNRTTGKKVFAGFKQVAPKEPHSPAFYSSSDLVESSSFNIISSKNTSSNNSLKMQERSGETSTASEAVHSRSTNQRPINYWDGLKSKANKENIINFYKQESAPPLLK